MSLLTKTFIACAVLFSTAAHASTPCDYDHKASEEYSYSIDRVKNVDYKVYEIGETAKKCTVSLDILMRDKWYKSKGTYVYGPDISERQACNSAELNAKENALKLYSPAVINSEKNMNCQLINKPKSATINCREWKTINIGGQLVKAWRNNCD